MKSKWRRLLWSVAAAFFTLLAVAIVLPFVFGDRIKEVIITELNKSIKTELNVSPDIEVSFLRHFPYASVSFYDVELTGQGDSTAQQFVQAQELAFFFNPFDIISGDYSFHSVYLRDGSVNVYVDENGLANYNIIKSTPDSLKQEPFLLTIQEAVLENMTVQYMSVPAEVDIRTRLEKANLDGSINGKDIQLIIKGKGHSLSVLTASASRELDLPYELNLQLDVKGELGTTTLLPSTISIAKNDIQAQGYYQIAETDSFDFEFEAIGGDIENLIGLVPVEFQDQFEGVDADGEYKFIAQWKGIGKGIENQFIASSLNLQKGQIYHPVVDREIKSLYANVYYSKDFGLTADEATLDIKDLEASFAGESIKGSLKLQGLKNPYVNLSLQGAVYLEALYPYIKEESLTHLSGKLNFNELVVEGPWKDLGNPSSGTIQSSGYLLANKVSAMHLGINYQLPIVDLSFQGKHVGVDTISFKVPGAKVGFSGSLGNLGPYLAQLSGEAEHSGHNLWLDGRIDAHEVDIRTITETFSINQTASAQNSTKKGELKRIFNVQGALAVNIDNLLFDSLHFESVSGKLQLKESQIAFQPLQMLAMNGGLIANGSMTFTENNSLNINTSIAANDLDIVEIFRQTGNFGQTSLTHKHLQGDLNGTVQMNVTWDDYSELNEESLFAQAKITISNGVLSNYEPLLLLSKRFIIDELSEIQFADISNTITVQNRKVSIPEMDIKTDDLALKLGGWHGFDNHIDYTFTIGLKHLLAAKFKKDKPDYREYEVEEGAIQLPIHMYGHLDDPSIELAWKPIGVAIKEEFRGEKGEWQEILCKVEVEKDPNKIERQTYESEPLEEVDFIFDEDGQQ